MTQKEIFKTIGLVSKNIDTRVYAVGGFVRDQLLGKNPNKIKDIDFVVEGSGVSFAQAFAAHVGEEVGRLVEFPDFDTARFVFIQETHETTNSGEEYVKRTATFEIEFAGARKESYRSTSRKPMVEATSIEEDLKRRDFTVNAMARQVLESGELGPVIDPFEGQKDLEEKTLRTPLEPDETFFDDPLRMLRAARFAAQLQFSIADHVFNSMYHNRKRLAIISAERIREEFMKLLSTKQPSHGLWLLHGSKLMDEFLPEVTALAGVEEVKGYTHKDNLSHTFAVVDNIAELSDKPLLRFAGLMHDIAKPQTKKFVRGRGWTFDMHEHLGKKMSFDVCRRLKLSRDETKYVTKLVRWHLQPIALMDEEVTDSAVRRLIVNLGDDLKDLLILCRADITTGNQKKKERRLRNYDYLDKRIDEVIEIDKMREFQSPVRGEEIMETCGLKPGPTVGKIKKAIEEAILEGEIPNDYDAAKAYFEKIKDAYLKDVQEWERK